MSTGVKGAGDGVRVKQSNPMKSIFPYLVVLLALVISFAVFYLIFGSADNFEKGDIEEGHPINIFGTIFKGGAVIPVGMSLTLMVLIFTVERFITIFFIAKGRSSADVFVGRIRHMLDEEDISGAIKACDDQKGSVANVVKAGLLKYQEVQSRTDADHDHNREAIQKELEEATTLELPMLERNLAFLSTIASLGVLVGLFGTVIGMIKAFQALNTSGAPDAGALATGISEALVNTAIGIFTSSLSIIFYNYFTAQIDALTYRIDEAGYSIVQTYEAKH